MYRLLIILIASVLSQVIFANDVKRIELRAGDSTTITTSLGSDLNVSRRGVVDIYHQGEGEWLVTGMRAGIITITEQPASESHYIVRVLPHDSQPTLPSAIGICQKGNTLPGITCSSEQKALLGITSSPAIYLSALQDCAEFNCNFQVQLKANLSDWLSHVTSILPRHLSFSSTKPGEGNLLTYCGRQTRIAAQKSLPDRWQAIISSKIIEFHCVEDFHRWRFKLSLKLIRLISNRSDDIGLTAKWQNSIQPTSPLPPQILTKIHAWNSALGSTLVGEPVIRFAAKEEALFQSGGELATPDSRSDKSEQVTWRNFGLEGKVTLFTIDEHQSELRYSLTLKSPSGDSNSTLDVHKLSATIPVTLAKPTILGILDLDGSEESRTGIPFIGKIPIIGPLISRSRREKTHARLVIWADLRLDKSDSENTLRNCNDSTCSSSLE